MASTRRTSGKPSASSASSPPEPAAPRTTLFIDHYAWSRRLGEALVQASIPFVAHHDRFAGDAPDAEWLAAAADQGWLVVTRDQRIRYKANEQAAVVRARLHLFALTQGGLSAAEPQPSSSTPTRPWSGTPIPQSRRRSS